MTVTIGKRVRWHRPLWEEVASMLVGDCLQWDIPKGKTSHNMTAALGQFKKSLRGVLLRSHFHNRRMFIVRLA